MIPLEYYLVLSGILFALGFYGVLARRSAILILIAVELMHSEGFIVGVKVPIAPFCRNGAKGCPLG